MEKCGKVYEVSGEVCWREREGCGERNGGSVVNCVKVWGPNTLPPTSPHSPHLSLHLPHTPTHFATPPLIPLPTSPLPPPTPQHTFLRQLPHLPHLLKVWQSYHVTKFLWRSYCGEVTGNRVCTTFSSYQYIFCPRV